MTIDKPSQLVPGLRFPEFQGAPDWMAGRCRDIARVLPGYGFPDKFQGKKKGQYPFYKVSDISRAIEAGRKYISEANNYVESDVLDEIRAKPVPARTIIFAKIGEAIRSNRRVITTKPAVIDNNTAGVKAMEAKSSDEFLFYLWSNVSLIDHAGGVVPAVSKSALENVPLCYPADPEEQQKIADCLSSLDDLIAAEARKLEVLRQHKRGLMQQLFPQPGENVPRLRFPEFRDTEEWEESNAGSLFTNRVNKGEDGLPIYSVTCTTGWFDETP
jgi:type I restriction enzyme S subunit